MQTTQDVSIRASTPRVEMPGAPSCLYLLATLHAAQSPLSILLLDAKHHPAPPLIIGEPLQYAGQPPHGQLTLRLYTLTLVLMHDNPPKTPNPAGSSSPMLIPSGHPLVQVPFPRLSSLSASSSTDEPDEPNEAVMSRFVASLTHSCCHRKGAITVLKLPMAIMQGAATRAFALDPRP